jgi:hypothetical protein
MDPSDHLIQPGHLVNPNEQLIPMSDMISIWRMYTRARGSLWTWNEIGSVEDVKVLEDGMGLKLVFVRAVKARELSFKIVMWVAPPS